MQADGQPLSPVEFHLPPACELTHVGSHYDPLSRDTYSGDLVTRAYLDRKYIATCFRNGDTATVQWGHLSHPTPGYTESFASVAMAHAAIEAWVSGLEIIPWGEAGPE